MTRKKIMKILQSRVDNFYLLFAFFAVTLSLLFFYLILEDRNIRHYDAYRQSVQAMIALEHRLDSVFFDKFRYIEHDETSRISKEMDAKIAFLRNSALREEFGEHIYKEFREIEAAYRRQHDLLMHFESLNANLTNSIHTMYDLKKSINLHYAEHDEKRHMVNALFFYVGQIYMGIPYDKATFDRLLKELNLCITEDSLFKYLCLHLENFSDNVERLNKILKVYAGIDLDSKLSHFSNEISQQYSNVREEQEWIAIGFFILAFMILFLLIFSYLRVKKTAKELLAFRYAIENSDNVIVITDADRHIEYVNEAFELHTGYTKEEVQGENPNFLKSDLVKPEVYQDLNETLDRGEKWQGELINRKKDGSLLYERVSIVPIFMDGEVVQYLAIKLDVTEYIRQQNALQQAATVYENIGDAIVITDARKKIVSVNRAFTDLFGFSEDEVQGKEPMIIMSLKEDRNFYRHMWHKLLTKGRWAGRVENRTKYGKIIPVWLTIAVVRDEKEEIQSFIAIYTNLEEIIRMEDKANYLAYHDSLTGLPNRTSFEMKIDDILSLAQVEKERVAILFIDLDRFKVINDTLGHHVGDEMLIQLARRIKSQLDSDDLFARIGGDEFVVVTKLKKHRREAGLLAERLLSVIREPILIQDYHLNTTASIGIAVYPDDGKEKNEIVKHADSAMYHAKDKGKDNFQFYTRQLSFDVEARLNLEQALLHALERKEMELCFQPLYALESREIIGAEALLRWTSAQLGTVPPDRFIAVAEETGMIIDIGYFVFEEACRAFMHWQEEGVEIENVSINISSLQFREEDVFVRFREILRRTGIPADKVEIEITERFIMEYSATNLSILEDLRGIGCKISIDDFGTGYSSMSYLKRLAIDTIKIDRSFIADLPDDSNDAEVSKAIIALSKSLGYQVVAEGIETAEQERFLKEHGCDIGQGFYFARPMPSEAFIAFFKAYKQNQTKK